MSCKKGTDPTEKIEGELAGGETTVFVFNSQAFATPAPNLSEENLEKHLAGDVEFEAIFVSNPAPIQGGLGPIFNNNSCVACHPSDGRVSHPTNFDEHTGFFLRISSDGKNEHGAPMPVSGFGTQFQHQSINSYSKEGRINVEYEEIPVTFADGTVVTLRKPIYTIIDPYIGMSSNIKTSPRIGMPVFGLGLLEAITEADILANEDIYDKNGDGISGKANYVWDPVNNKTSLGRFGWKANAPSLMVQTAGAYNEDMGITNPVFPVESSHGQSNGDLSSVSPEITQEILDVVTFYVQTLGVPAGRNFDDPIVIEGRKTFERISCTSCHISSFTTGTLAGVPEVSNQKIFAYTDMLLHDMGEGLADNREDFLADGKEWKTRPLWGIGLTYLTNNHTNFLHDGRARNLTEAILWHGGEAKESRDKFTELSKEERKALVMFLNSL